MNAAMPFYDVHTLEGAVAESLGARRLTNDLLLAFAIAALVLAAVGIYGVWRSTSASVCMSSEFASRSARQREMSYRSSSDKACGSSSPASCSDSRRRSP